MAEVIFNYKDNEYKIQCQENQKLEEICNHFISKLKLNENDIYYSYDGKSGSMFDKNLSFEQMANSLDKERKKMNILAMSYDNDNNDKVSLIRSKNIICPKCGELIKMKIDNYKIKLFECKNNHMFQITTRMKNDFSLWNWPTALCSWVILECIPSDILSSEFVS